MLIDTHCHLDFHQFDEDRKQVIEQAFSQGITHLINVGSEVRGSVASLEMAKEYDNVYAAVGIHPHHAEETTKDDIAYIEDISGGKKVVAIGEVGLDYFDREKPDGLIERPMQKIQQEMLIGFIEVALRKDLPLVFHCRNAADDFMAIIADLLKKEDMAVIHCFSQDKKFLKFCLDKGMFVSFTGNITYKNAQDLRDLVAYCPLDRMFFETDAPYLAPQSMRGKRNEPAFVRFVAEEAARIKNADIKYIAGVTSAAAKNFFRIS